MRNADSSEARIRILCKKNNYAFLLRSALQASIARVRITNYKQLLTPRLVAIAVRIAASV